jgi:glutamate racemase
VKGTVGLFDSGLGGLITARYLHQLRPDLSLLYYGDTAHLPYGDKSPAQIRAYTREIVSFLVEKGAEAIVIACNTASAVAHEVAVEAAQGLPVFDAIQPALARLLNSTPATIGIIGTYTTITSGVYRDPLREAGYLVQERPTPLLVPMIEEGWLDHPATHATIETYLSALGEIDTLLLACTHYPLIEPAIRRYYQTTGKPVQILSTARLLAEAVATTLPRAEDLSPPSLQIWVSDPNPRFQALAERFWGTALPIMPASTSPTALAKSPAP